VEPNDKTFAYYESNASDFVRATANADMSSVMSAFIEMLSPQALVLDWGCGSGRDSRTLLNLGFSVTATDASPSLCKIARDRFGVEVRCESFNELAETGTFDAIWANASLLHVPKHNLGDIFAIAHKALKDKGVLYVSFKYGSFEGMRAGRWFTDLNEAMLSSILSALFEVNRIWTTNDVRPDRKDELWLNCLATKRS